MAGLHAYRAIWSLSTGRSQTACGLEASALHFARSALMPEPPSTPPHLEKAAEAEDAFGLSRAASTEELQKLKMAEELFQLRHQRKKRRSKREMATQTILALVAVGGFFANAYQSYSNKQQQERQAQADQDRWTREFERAKRADKYRAFFETSALATDKDNVDKRLVGYALLEEFVDDQDYNTKASLMLEEALMRELRDNDEPGLQGGARTAVIAILTALSETPDCRALEKAVRSVARISKRHAQVQDAEESQEVFGVYARRMLGRAYLICHKPEDFESVRTTLRTTLIRNPEFGGKTGKLTSAQANARIAEIVRDSCLRELAVTGVGDCAEIFPQAVKLCDQRRDRHLMKEDEESCKVWRAAAPEAALVQSAVGAPDGGSAASEGSSP
jgi:hypothetical protein